MVGKLEVECLRSTRKDCFYAVCFDQVTVKLNLLTLACITEGSIFIELCNTDAQNIV